jgi:hypothetical protein
MATYEVAYSSKTTSDKELSFSDIVLVEAETHEQLAAKVADIVLKLGPPGNYYVDSVGGNPYEPRSKRRVPKKIAKDLNDLVSKINALILRPNGRAKVPEPTSRMKWRRNKRTCLLWLLWLAIFSMVAVL